MVFQHNGGDKIMGYTIRTGSFKRQIIQALITPHGGIHSGGQKTKQDRHILLNTSPVFKLYKAYFLINRALYSEPSLAVIRRI
jgi:hypothetical protein